MDGRASVRPTEINGSAGTDEVSGPATSGNSDEPARFPLTIREVIRRGRTERDELVRLRAEVTQLRIRAESAEHLLGALPDDGRDATAGRGAAPRNGHAAPNGKAPTNGRVRGAAAPNPPGAPNGWAPAAVLPRSKER